MKKGIVTFCGHRDVWLSEEQEKRFKNEILSLFNEYDYISFYMGDEGVFDHRARLLLNDLKAKKKLSCEIVYITPYLSNNLEEKKVYYGEIIYPPLETVPKRFAIPRRNNWMAEQADVLIAFVRCDWGGAWNMLDYAERLQKKHGKPKIINIAK